MKEHKLRNVILMIAIPLIVVMIVLNSSHITNRHKQISRNVENKVVHAVSNIKTNNTTDTDRIEIKNIFSKMKK